MYKRQLLLCYNRPLGESLTEAFAGDDRVTAGSFHRWGRDLLEAADLLPEGTLPNEFFQETMPELIPDAADALDRQWDALVIDEGQDFSPGWYTALFLTLDDPDHDVVNVFADPNQNIYRTDWQSPLDVDPFVLDINCRNTNQIAHCLLYTSPSPRDATLSRMPSSA